MMYAAAITAIKDSGAEKSCIYRKIDKKKKKSDKWEFGMKRHIDDLRADISRISQMRDPNPSTKMKKNNNAMKQKYNITNEEVREVRLETLKQCLLALINRLSRYQKRQKQFRQNNDFAEKPSKNNRQKLFDKLQGNRTEINDPPSKENIEEFWKPMYKEKLQQRCSLVATIQRLHQHCPIRVQYHHAGWSNHCHKKVRQLEEPGSW